MMSKKQQTSNGFNENTPLTNRSAQSLEIMIVQV